MPVPQIIGTPNTAVASGTSNLVVTKPVDLQDGDLLVAGIRSQVSGSDPANISVPSGFQRLGPAVPNPISVSTRLHGFWVKPITNAINEPSTYLFNDGQSARRVATLFVVRGVDLANIQAGANSAYDASAITNGRRAGGHATDVPALGLFLGGSEFSSGNDHAPASTPSGYTHVVDVVTAGSVAATSRTYMWVGQHSYSASPTQDAEITWASTASSPSATTLELRGLEQVITYAGPVVEGTPTVAAHSSTNSISIAKPAGVQTGDYLVAVYRSQDSGVTSIIAPEGFTSLGPVMPNPSGSTNRTMQLFGKSVSVAEHEPSTYTFTKEADEIGGSRIVMTMFRVSGIDHVNPVAGLTSSYGGTSITNGRSTAGYAVDTSETVHALALFYAGGEFTDGNSHVPTTTPSGWDEVALAQTNATSSGSRTSLWVGARPTTGLSTPSATILYTSTPSGPAAQGVALRGGDDIPPYVSPGVAVRLGSGDTGRATVYTGSDRVPISSVKMLRPGFSTVAELLATHGATWAHRGGSGFFPEMSEYAYDQSALRGYGVLEFSAQRTSDGVWFGMHDNNFDRTSDMVGSGTPATTSWATVQGYQNTLLSNGTPRPYWRLIEFLDKYTPTHVVLVDPKNAIGYTAEFLDILDTHGGPTKIVVKWSGAGQTAANLSTAARARGYQTWGYFYATNIDDGSFETWWSAWTLLGMEYGAVFWSDECGTGIEATLALYLNEC